MTTDFQNTKLDKAFGHLDVDGNGVVEHADVLALGSRLFAGFGEAPTSAKGQDVLNGLETFWQSLLSATDLDGDRQISPHEWRTGMADAFIHDRAGFDAGLRPAAEAVMRLADTDGDGTLGLDEFHTLQRAFGTPSEQVAESFARMDTDGDGALSVDELVAATRQYYTGADENAHGNWFFGRP
ncbi:calcium-binding protein [Longispora fulva]|uniref:Ca2+-binding EF-hand superfamily protein n=1 Tax=Longispora fulva TaxID=619741 RepID=A0A8J7GM34_9ACTN|nr:EF-hand domain-containing protein [Longispora fulva]MBG6135554.1 Ca2+-binding EF-hand superfamily protein [Longispora fulva]GIG56207.1 calcium-binding protein [Longispora fulva]